MARPTNRKVEQQQLEILEGLVGKTLPSFKYLTFLLWGKEYWDCRSMKRDKKRLEDYVDIEYSDDTWAIKIISMK